MNKEEFLLHQNVKKWNIVATIFFVISCLVLYFIFQNLNSQNITITFFDILILSLANYRLIRLFVYDNITLFVREYFMDLKVADEKYEYVNSKSSFKLTVYKLLNCPWCFGIWTTFISAFFYFNFESFKIIFILLAISAIASSLVLMANFIGWSAELKKIQVKKEN